MPTGKLREIIRDIPDGLEDNAVDSRMYEEMKRGVRKICHTLDVSTQYYEPHLTIAAIKEFSSPDRKVFRVLYSEINSVIMSLDEERRGAFCSNAENLLLNVINAGEINDVVKIVLKIYDHIQLVNAQIDNVKGIIAPRITEVESHAKTEIRKEIKEAEREYITILGIFAAVIIGFVGAFNFSSSVLDNIGNASLKKLVVVSITIGMVFYMIISLLIKFLYDINGKKFSFTCNDNLALCIVFLTLGIILGVILFC